MSMGSILVNLYFKIMYFYITNRTTLIVIKLISCNTIQHQTAHILVCELFN